MKHIAFTDDRTKIKIAILIKERDLIKNEIERHYIIPLEQQGIPRESIIVFSLAYDINNKAPAKESKEYLDKLLNAINILSNIKTIFCADGSYFKYLTGTVKTSTALGYIIDCKIKKFTHLKVILAINYRSFFYNDNLFAHLDTAIETLVQHINKKHITPGTDVIHNIKRPFTLVEIEKELDNLHSYDALTCDIETFSLRFNLANIGTIGFAHNEHEGIVIDVAYTDVLVKETKALLKEFFLSYKGSLIFHGSLFDVKVMIYVLFMKHDCDFIGMQKGIKAFSNLQDSMVLLYLALNSTADIPLDLKSNSQTFLGNYAEENIKDIKLIPLKKLVIYNLKDCLATWFLTKKYIPIVKQDNQWNFYKQHALPAIPVLIKMMLIGLPMNIVKVHDASDKLEKIRKETTDKVLRNPHVIQAKYQLQLIARNLANDKLKVKVKPLSDFEHIEFNPNSGIQLQVLFYEVMGLPVIDFTKKKKPATGAGTIEKLLYHVSDRDEPLLKQLIDLAQVSTILDNFIKNFKEKAFLRSGNHEWSGTYWLNGNLKLTGTQGGRLSSSDPNLQNIPSTGTKYAKIIKECFEPPKNWLMVGADFSSLEDRINAILTQDKNKIKVYTDGYDGHCLRAFAYFADKMPDIIDTVESINSIAYKYEEIRQDSKQPTFALTYLGTWHTLVKNLGIPPDQAMAIEDNYHKLYKESDKFSAEVTQYASKHGYVELAFGLRLRTPILAKTIINSTKTPYEAEKEARSANNAITQSWGQLTTRAAIEFEAELQKSPYINDIFLCNTIHDAIYLIIRDEPEIVKWTNDHLIQAMQWNDDDKIRSTDVPMEATMEIYYPSWAQAHKVKNNATLVEITKRLEEIHETNK